MMINPAKSLTYKGNSYDFLLSYKGKSLSIKQWAKELDMPYHGLLNKIRNGFSIEEIVEKDPYELQKTYNEIFIERIKPNNVKSIKSFFIDLQSQRTVKELRVKQLIHPKVKGIYQLWVTFYSFGILRNEAKDLCERNKNINLTWSIQNARKTELEIIEQDKTGKVECLASSIKKS